MNPSSFSRGYAEDTLCWVEFPTKLLEAVEGFFQVSDELVLGLGFDDDVINISLSITM